ncbi:MAG TPA: tetratricopeptide repeat protein [Gemmataceae bacterium]|jgi:Tfp pilus assembly protein PilF|nr:tetratricopeptide repeat protein [Gemmataceae bacterium]
MAPVHCILLLAFSVGELLQPPAPKAPPPATKVQQQPAPKSDKMPMTDLAPAILIPNLCSVKYRITTDSPQCQAYFDQGLGYFYSYVWMEAARSFETAAKADPNCPMAWWGLSRALERWGKSKQTDALKKAGELKDRASFREQQLILARMQEKGMVSGVGGADARKAAAIKTLDTLLAIHDDDEEGWYARAQLTGGAGLFGGQVSSVPFYKALLHVNPMHPGANHELLHFYETFRRPALGWLYAEKYIESSPGIPHPFHMQAHLATRLGRWDKTADRSAKAIQLEQEYHRVQGVLPRDDQQYNHHLEILTVSLIHDGRFKEALAARADAEKNNYEHWLPWFRLAVASRDWPAALKVVAHYKKTEKITASYMAAVVYLKQNLPARAGPEVEVLRQAYQDKKQDRLLQDRLNETQGVLLCQTGAADAGLKLLAKAVERTKDDYGHHAWGNGAYLMEIWGVAALQAGKFDQAEEALLEALAHDPGSACAALGLQVLCESQGRTEEASRYAELAQRSWKRADANCLAQELAAIRGNSVAKQTTVSSSIHGGE